MILVVDNYDSFVHNLARYVRELGENVVVARNDAITLKDVQDYDLKGVILSPGPGRPETAGICKSLIATYPKIPILGVCLGHQCIAEVYGGVVVSSKEPMHGRSSTVTHHKEDLFTDLPSPLQVGRYHSLSVCLDGVDILNVQATTQDGEIMAIQHKAYPHYGVQFHPESILTPHGKGIIRKFLEKCDEVVL